MAEEARSEKRTLRAPMIALALGMVAMVVGCDFGEKKPMKEPLTPADAMEADGRMQSEADELMREYQERTAEPPPPIPR